MVFKIRKRITISVCLLVLPVITQAIEPTWEVDFGSVFDNREGDAGYTKAETFFFATVAPEIGIKFTEKDRIAGGAVWTQPLENGVKNGKIIPTVYYRHETDVWKFSMGMFPRTQLREPLPGFLWSDSLSYSQRNIRGALIQYENKNVFFDAYIDWRGMQSKTTREAFNIVFHGEFKPESKFILFGSHLMMNHFARKKNSPDNERVIDNFLVNPYVGIDLSHETVLDSLVFKAGGLLTIERNRADDMGWRTPGGVWIDLIAEWRYLGIKNSFYAGGKLYPEYSSFGSQLYMGDAFYSSDIYNRTDIYAKIIRNRYMDLEAQLNFNYARNSFIFYQRLVLDINIGNLCKRRGKPGYVY